MSWQEVLLVVAAVINVGSAVFVFFVLAVFRKVASEVVGGFEIPLREAIEGALDALHDEIDRKQDKHQVNEKDNRI